MIMLDPGQEADFRLALGHFATGLVVLTGPGPIGHAWMRCTTYAEYDGGDHLLVAAQVGALRLGGGQPLLYHRGRAGRFTA